MNWQGFRVLSQDTKTLLTWVMALL